MSDAIARMALYLAQAEPWKPDRFSTPRERVCVRCRKVKDTEKFGMASSICRECHTKLTQEWRKNQRKAWLK